MTGTGSQQVAHRISRAKKGMADLHSSFFLRHSFFCAFLLALFNSFFLSGCGTQLPLHRQMSPLPPGPICRVAVLPFLNDSDYPFGDTIVKKVFSTQLQDSGNFLVIQEGEIYKIYQQLHLLPGVVPSLEQYQIITNRINAQLLITGIILEMREDRGELQGTVNPMLVMEIQIRDGTSGETLWTVFHRRQGTDYKKTMHFGTIHTVTGLSRQMAEEIINLWFKKGLTQCEILPQF
jgi:hypothetical protein